MIQNGVRIEWLNGRPPLKFNKGASLTPDSLTHAQQLWLDAELGRLQACGAIHELPLRFSSHVSRAFLVDKDPVWRLVIDLRPVNNFSVAPTTSFETLKRVSSLALQDDHMFSFDLKDGFYAIGIEPSSRRYLQFVVGDRLFEFTSLPMGWNASPGLFCKVMASWVKFLRAPSRRTVHFHRLTRSQREALDLLREALGETMWERGVRLLPYMDDFLCFCRERTESLQLREAIDLLLRLLGLSRHPSKGEWDPVQNLEHLGLEIDSKAGVFRVSAKRQTKIRRSAADLGVLAAKQRRRVPARRLAGFIGLAQSVYLAVPAARFFLRSLHNVLPHGKASWAGRVLLDRAALRDLQWWATFGSDPRHNGRGIWRLPDTAVLHCDALDTGWGGVLNQSEGARGFWRPAQLQEHITLKELRAVRLTVQTFLPKLRGRRVLLWEDNQAVQHILTNLTSRSPELMHELRKLWWLLDSNDITLRAKYSRSAANVWADRLSRAVDNGDWKLNPSLFQLFDERWGPHSFDRFATANNCQVPRFNSAHPDPLATGIDAFAQSDADWARENNWVNPPWELLEDVWAKLRNSGAAATVTTPCWPDRLFYQLFTELADEVIDVPCHHNLFFPGRLGSSASVGPPRWNVTVFRIAGRRRGSMPSAGTSFPERAPLRRSTLDLKSLRLQPRAPTS